jgi:hypothetical protein
LQKVSVRFSEASKLVAVQLNLMVLVPSARTVLPVDGVPLFTTSFFSVAVRVTFETTGPTTKEGVVVWSGSSHCLKS